MNPTHTLGARIGPAGAAGPSESPFGTAQPPKGGPVDLFDTLLKALANSAGAAKTPNAVPPPDAAAAFSTSEAAAAGRPQPGPTPGARPGTRADDLRAATRGSADRRASKATQRQQAEQADAVGQIVSAVQTPADQPSDKRGASSNSPEADGADTARRQGPAHTAASEAGVPPPAAQLNQLSPIVVPVSPAGQAVPSPAGANGAVSTDGASADREGIHVGAGLGRDSMPLGPSPSPRSEHDLPDTQAAPPLQMTDGDRKQAPSNGPTRLPPVNNPQAGAPTDVKPRVALDQQSAEAPPASPKAPARPTDANGWSLPQPRPASNQAAVADRAPVDSSSHNVGSDSQNDRDSSARADGKAAVRTRNDAVAEPSAAVEKSHDGPAPLPQQSGTSKAASLVTAAGQPNAQTSPAAPRPEFVAQAAPPEAASTVRAPASAAALDGEDVSSQLVQAIRMQWKGGVGDARLTLHPEYLGEVSIALRVENGSVNASLSADTPGVRAWMEANESVLRQGLAEQGLSLNRLTVSSERPSFSDEGGAREDRRSAQQQPNESRQDARSRRRPQEPSFEIVM